MQSENNYPDDEISLIEIFSKIWAVRVPVLVILLVVSMGYWSFWAYKALRATEPSYTYAMPIHFTFKGIENGKYPNGSPFRLADIIAPAILNRVYSINKLSAEQIDRQTFMGGFNIRPYAPEYDLVLAKYKSAMMKKNITSQEISRLQEKMKVELDSVVLKNAMLSFTPHGNQLAVNLGRDILMDVARVWSEKAINEDGVVNLDVTMYSKKIFDETAFAASDYLIYLELLMKNIKLVRANIDTLLARPNGKTIADSKSGYTLPDLQKLLDDTVNYEIKQLVNPIKKLGISKNEETVSLYYKEKIGDLRLRKELLLNKSKVISSALENYKHETKQSGLLANGGVVSGEANIYSSSPQLGDAFLEKIINLSEKSGDVKYRQGLSLKIIKYGEEAAEIDYEISQFREILANIESGHSKGETTLRTFYRGEIVKKLPVILNKLRNFTDITNRIYRRLSKDNLGSGGMLYSHTGQDVIVGGHVDLLTKMDLLKFALLLFLSFCLSLFVFLVRGALKGNRVVHDKND